MSAPIDKTGWPPGPWDDEPDRLEWRDAATGLTCLMVRVAAHGAWCGYVALPPGHPWRALELSGGEGPDVAVHGGVTYGAEPCNAEAGICHTPAPGEPDDVRWIGFDTAHHGDFSPGRARLGGPFVQRAWETYRDAAYVRAEVVRLAAQAAAAAHPADHVPARLTAAWVVASLAEIRLDVAEPEVARAMEDGLRQAVLEAIAAGRCDDAAACAAAALGSMDLACLREPA